MVAYTEEWQKLKNKLKKGDVVIGTVCKIQRYGVFVDLKEVFKGLVLVPHISQKPLKSINEYPQVGETVKAVVLDFSFNERNIAFSFISLLIIQT